MYLINNHYYIKGYDRPIEINMGMIESTLQEYSPIIIMETLQDFFQEVGKFVNIKEQYGTFN